MDNTREILAGLTSLASWRNLALLLAVINLKNLPFVWHVSFPWPLFRPSELTSSPRHVTLLTESTVPPAVSLRRKSAFETQCATSPKGETYRGLPRQTNTSHLCAMHGHISHTVARDRLQPAQIKQHLLYGSGCFAYSAREPNLQSWSRQCEQGTRPGVPSRKQERGKAGAKAQASLDRARICLLHIQARNQTIRTI